MKTINLKEYKAKKRAKKIFEDLDNILKEMDKSILIYEEYRRYVPVKDLLNHLDTNREFIKIYHKKYKYIINKTRKTNES